MVPSKGLLTRRLKPRRMNIVLLRKEDGSSLTGRGFNSQLKIFSRDMVYLEGEYYGSHSVRAGTANMMAKLGSKDADIMSQGMCACEDFLCYCKGNIELPP